MEFLIHNGARDVETRSIRAMRPDHGGLTQFILNGTRRLIRGKPVRVTEAQLQQYRAELLKKELAGVLYVTKLDGVTLVSLATNDEAPPAPPVNSRPNMPMDSADKDVPTGERMTSLQDLPPPAEFLMPVPPPVAAVESPIEPGADLTGLPPVDASDTRTVKKKGGR